MQPRIMLIDDSPLISKIITSHLSTEGYTIETLNTAHGAIERIDDFRPHVLLVDLGLPGTRGDILVTKIRNLGPLCTPHIIIISAEDEADLKQFVACGMADDYFCKGAPFTDLQQKISRHVCQLPDM